MSDTGSDLIQRLSLDTFNSSQTINQDVEMTGLVTEHDTTTNPYLSSPATSDNEDTYFQTQRSGYIFGNRN